MVLTNLFAEQEQRCRGNLENLWAIADEGRGMNWESRADIYTLPYAGNRQLARGCRVDVEQLGALR